MLRDYKNLTMASRRRESGDQRKMAFFSGNFGLRGRFFLESSNLMILRPFNVFLTRHSDTQSRFVFYNEHLAFLEALPSRLF